MSAEVAVAHAPAYEGVIRASGLLSLLMPKNSGVGVLLKGLDGQYRVGNQAACQLLGLTPDEISGRTDRELFPEHAWERLQLSDDEIRNGAQGVQEEIDLALGGDFGRWLLLKFPVLATNGAMQSIGTVVFEVSRQELVAEMRQALQTLERTNQELRLSLVELDRLASTDKLTGTWNRRRLEEAVANEMDRLRRYDHPLSLLVLDVDYFKRVNDRFGHACGDRLLIDLTARIRAGLRATDSLTRWGGEEFIVLCPNTTLATARVLAERLRRQVASTPFAAVGEIRVSLGVAECMPGESWDEWFHRADGALLRAKAAGRDQVQIAPGSPGRAAGGEKISANFLRLVWNAAYASGHDVIDAEHQALFHDANELLSAILSKRPAEEIRAVVNKLVQDVDGHFRNEEAVFSAVAYPGAARHAARHRDLLSQAAVLIDRMRSGTTDVGDVFKFLAGDIIVRHILEADREYFPYLDAQRRLFAD